MDNWTWTSSCLSKQKIFFWLLIQDKLNTRDMVIRKNFYVEDGHCVPCKNNDMEDVIHLFLPCDLCQIFWLNLGMTWNTYMGLIDMLIEGNQRMNLVCFKYIIIVGFWSIWKHRNGIIFDHKVKDLQYCIKCFKEHLRMACKPGLTPCEFVP